MLCVLFVFQGAAVGVCVLCSASRADHQILRLSAAAEGKQTADQQNVKVWLQAQIFLQMVHMWTFAAV